MFEKKISIGTELNTQAKVGLNACLSLLISLLSLWPSTSINFQGYDIFNPLFKIT